MLKNYSAIKNNLHKKISGKKFGQHFLNSVYIVKKIVKFARIKNAVVIEIGAGKGILTREIAKQAQIVYAIEIDHFYADILTKKNIPNTVIINTDFLNFDLTNYKNCIIVGNIPYYITTRIIEKLVRDRDKFLHAVLTIQREYGERLLAKPGNPQYSSITCYVNYYFNVVRGFNIAPNFFTPEPKVSSMVLGFEHRDPPFLLKNEQEFWRFINGIFRYRRKILKNALLNYLNSLPKLVDKDILTKRPEQLELTEYFQLYERVKADNIPLSKPE
ncbi:MAG: 16S rRNA (adenine(1518)-N(6)/adenine(1519)-N(6))-dimethyltransferase RsmA [bacterium]